MKFRISFWADAARGGDPKKFREGLCPAGYDVIPAFSLLHMEMACKGWSKWEPGEKTEDGKWDHEISPAKKGYGMGINSISVIQCASLYSIKDKLPRVLADTLDASKIKQQKWQSKFHSIKDLIETEKVSHPCQLAAPQAA